MKKSMKITIVVIVVLIGGIYVKSLFNDNQQNTVVQEKTTETDIDTIVEDDDKEDNEESTNGHVADGKWVRMLRIDEIENSEIAITKKKLENVKKSEEYTNFVTNTGEEMKILLNPTRADYYSEKDVDYAFKESIEFIHALMNYNGEGEFYYLKRLTSYLNGNLNAELHHWIKLGKYEPIAKGATNYGENNFPLEAYKELLNNVSSRRIQAIDIYESELFSEPYLDLIATVTSTATLKNGKVETQKHKFQLSFNNLVEQRDRINMLEIEKIN